MNIINKLFIVMILALTLLSPSQAGAEENHHNHHNHHRHHPEVIYDPHEDHK